MVVWKDPFVLTLRSPPVPPQLARNWDPPQTGMEPEAGDASSSFGQLMLTMF